MTVMVTIELNVSLYCFYLSKCEYACTRCSIIYVHDMLMAHVFKKLIFAISQKKISTPIFIIK